MNKLNLPKFYVGQKVAAITNHSQGYYKKGDVFTITGIFKSHCSCKTWLVSIGIKSTTKYTVCSSCYNRVLSKPECLFSDCNFSPLQQQKFPLIKLSKIMEKEKEEVLIEN